MARDSVPARGGRLVRVQRVYDDPGRDPGEYRVLVDRLWPRGLAKAAADQDEWAKDVAPSTELRKWYGHARDRFPEFARRYRAELNDPEAASALSRLRDIASERPLVLLTATREVEISGATVLMEVLRERTG